MGELHGLGMKLPSPQGSVCSVLQDITALDKRINDDLTEGKVPVMVIAYAGEKKQLLFDVDILKYITFINRSFPIARIDPSPNVLTVMHHDYIMVTSWLYYMVTRLLLQVLLWLVTLRICHD